MGLVGIELARCLSDQGLQETNQLDFALSRFFHREWIGDVEVRVGVCKEEEGLVWAFGGFSVLRREDDFEIVGRA